MVRLQASKKTDFTVDLIWWGSLRLAPIIKIFLLALAATGLGDELSYSIDIWIQI